MSNSFFRIPDSLLDDPRFFDALPEHQMIFIRLLRLAAFKKIKHNILGHIIELLPGQLCYSERKIAEICGKRFTKDLVRGCLRYFSRVDFLHQEVHHGKNVITIKHRDCYDLIKNQAPPTCPPKVHQGSTTKEYIIDSSNKLEEHTTREAIESNIIPIDEIYSHEQNENYQDVDDQPHQLPKAQNDSDSNITYISGPSETNSNKLQNKSNKTRSNINKSKQKDPNFNKTLFREHVSLTQQEYDNLVSLNGKDFTEAMIDAVDSYKGSKGKTYSSDYHVMKQGGWAHRRIAEDRERAKTNPSRAYLNGVRQTEYDNLF